MPFYRLEQTSITTAEINDRLTPLPMYEVNHRLSNVRWSGDKRNAKDKHKQRRNDNQQRHQTERAEKNKIKHRLIVSPDTNFQESGISLQTYGLKADSLKTDSYENLFLENLTVDGQCAGSRKK